MLIKTVIVDDEVHSSGDLKNLLLKYCRDVEVVAIAQTVQQAVAEIIERKPDLVFLDVELPDGDGFKVVEQFPGHNFNLVFVTAFDQYAIKAIKNFALDYLLKPVDKDELISAVNKARIQKEKVEFENRKSAIIYGYQQKNGYNQKIALPTMEGLSFIQREEIVYCAADSSYTSFYLNTKEKIVASKPLSYFEEILQPDQFCRTHHSFIVNLLHVRKYMRGKGGHVVMSNGAMVPVAVRMKTNFLDRFEK
jgi:two-component system LytT family response regulator